MAEKHSVACPSCGASLKVTKDSLIGKRVPCPSCKTPFVIKVPTGDYIPLADVEGYIEQRLQIAFQGDEQSVEILRCFATKGIAPPSPGNQEGRARENHR